MWNPRADPHPLHRVTLPSPPTVDPNRKEAEMALFIIFTALAVAVFALVVTWGGLTNERMR